MNYWLLKTEPEVFSWDDLIRCPNSSDSWDGIRNYQARNMLRDDFKVGDAAFIYHSRIADPCIVGIAQVVEAALPDETALDPQSRYFDPKSAKIGVSRWYSVKVQAKKRFQVPVTLKDMRSIPNLEGLALLKAGQRLSILPVSLKHWETICRLGQSSISS